MCILFAQSKWNSVTYFIFFCVLMRVGEWSEILSITGDAEPLKVLQSPTSTSLVLTDGADAVFAVRMVPLPTTGPPGSGFSVAPPCDGNLVARGDRIFQHVFPKEKQRFGFQVTNFSDQTLVFTIQRKGSCTDINKINCLDPRSCETITSDYSKEEREMVLSALEKAEDGTDVTVAMDEDEGGVDKASGTYFTISVYPTRAGTDWTSTVWSTQDYIVSSRRSIRRSIQAVPSWGSPVDYREAPRAWGVPPIVGGRSFGVAAQTFQPAFATAQGFGGGGGGGGHIPGGWGASVSQSFSPPSPAYSPASSPSYGAQPSFGASTQVEPTQAQQEAFSMAALATKVTHGERNSVTTQSVNLEPRYDKGCVPATLCLSLLPADNVLLFPEPTKMERFALAMACATEYFMKKATHKKQQAVDALPSFEPEEECVVCMDAAPSCVFAQCGHSAVCSSCAPKLEPKKCPLCRGTIHACIILQ